jgi:hypothetical protein
MSMIFDQFANRQKAEDFVRAVKKDYGLEGQIFDNEEAAYEHDWFPFPLLPPIVHIDRPENFDRFSRDDCLRIETEVEGLGGLFGGTFAGT